MRKLAIVPFLLLCVLTVRAQGTFTAASCSRADVNGLINNTGGAVQHQAVNGDTIIIPACGSTAWTSPITIPGIGITITGTGTPNTGAGTTGAGTSTTTLTETPNNAFFIFSGLAFGQTARVSLINMNSATPATVGSAGAFTIQFYGACTASGCANVRVDNITYGTDNWEKNLSDGGFVGADNVYGVLDHNTANESGSVGVGVGDPFVQNHYSGWLGIGANGDNSFSAADSFGTASAMYLENNSWNFVRGTENDVAAADGLQGGTRYVCRFNTITNMSGTGVCSGHGTAWLGRPRGQRQVELYHNDITTTASDGCDAVMGEGSGTGYFFSNLVHSAAQGCNEFVRLDIARFIMTASPWNSCDGTQPWDATPFTSSSVCFDQLGRGGGGALLQGATPVLASAPGTPCTSPGQCYPGAPLDPVYEAGDTSTPGNVGAGIAGFSGAGSPGHITQNVDFYGEVSQAAQTTTSSPFNGTTGTGYGTFARRPTTCTTGVLYDATDQGTWNNGAAGDIFYKCTSTNTWTLLYTPYIYPHPLTGNPVSPPSAPATTIFVMLRGNMSLNGKVVLP